jgi:hypothetical protein
LLVAVADHHRGVQQKGDGTRDTFVSPTPADDLPKQSVEKRNQSRPRPAKPATEGRGIRDSHPAEDPTDPSALQQRKIIENAPSVEQEGHPGLHHEARAKVAPDPRTPPVDPAAHTEDVEQAPKHNETSAIGEVLLVVPEPQRGGVALNVGPRSDTVIVHRLGASRCRVRFLYEVPST